MLLFLKKQKVLLIFLVLLVISMKVDLLLFVLFSFLSIAFCINLGKVFIHYYTTIKFDLNKVNKELNQMIPMIIILLGTMVIFKTSFFVVLLLMCFVGLLIFKEFLGKKITRV